METGKPYQSPTSDCSPPPTESNVAPQRLNLPEIAMLAWIVFLIELQTFPAAMNFAEDWHRPILAIAFLMTFVVAIGLSIAVWSTRLRRRG